MRHDTIESLVLFNHALMVEAEEACARSVFVQCHSLVVQFDWLTSSTADPPWKLSARAASHASYARYGQMADTAWTRGLSRWRQRSQAFVAAHTAWPGPVNFQRAVHARTSANVSPITSAQKAKSHPVSLRKKGRVGDLGGCN